MPTSWNRVNETSQRNLYYEKDHLNDTNVLHKRPFSSSLSREMSRNNGNFSFKKDKPRIFLEERRRSKYKRCSPDSQSDLLDETPKKNSTSSNEQTKRRCVQNNSHAKVVKDKTTKRSNYKHLDKSSLDRNAVSPDNKEKFKTSTLSTYNRNEDTSFKPSSAQLYAEEGLNEESQKGLHPGKNQKLRQQNAVNPKLDSTVDLKKKLYDTDPKKRNQSRNITKTYYPVSVEKENDTQFNEKQKQQQHYKERQVNHIETDQQSNSLERNKTKTTISRNQKRKDNPDESKYFDDKEPIIKLSTSESPRTKQKTLKQSKVSREINRPESLDRSFSDRRKNYRQHNDNQLRTSYIKPKSRFEQRRNSSNSNKKLIKSHSIQQSPCSSRGFEVKQKNSQKYSEEAAKEKRNEFPENKWGKKLDNKPKEMPNKTHREKRERHFTKEFETEGVIGQEMKNVEENERLKARSFTNTSVQTPAWNENKSFDVDTTTPQTNENIQEAKDGGVVASKVDEVDPELKEYASRKIQKKTFDAIGRTGGAYIPPFKLAELQKHSTDPSTPEFQRQSWDALRKSINGLVNKVNLSNITNITQDLFRENLVRGRGLIARSIIRAQMASPGFTHIYAALLSVLNSKLPELGDLITRRILLQFRRAYRRNDKLVCKACTKFLAHLVNHKMIHELLALQLSMLLLEQLTDDSIELCVEFMQEVGQVLQDISPQAFRVICDRLRAVAQEGTVDRRVQYLIEEFQRTVATKFAEFPGVIPELDLVEEEDKITHEIDLLDPDIKGDEMLNVFKLEPVENFLKYEAEWSEFSAEILGTKPEDGESDSSSDDSEEYEEENNQAATVEVHDMTEQDIIALRKTIYLTIMSSASFEECLHKILKLNIKEGQEIQVCTMLIDCNAMERTFQRFFALQAERLCRLSPIYEECFLNCLEKQYSMIHHLETNKIRSTAKFFAHLLHTDAFPWSCLELFTLTEESTTSASRIFVKVLFQELAEHMGLRALHEKLLDPSLSPHLKNIFPTDHPKNIRFSINFFTAIGLGGLTASLREILADLQNQSILSAETSSSSEEDSENSLTDSSSSSSPEKSSKRSHRPQRKTAPHR